MTNLRRMMMAASDTGPDLTPASGNLYSSGRATLGRLGTGLIATGISSPVQVGSLVKWGITAGLMSSGNVEQHAIRQDGTLWSWGAGLSGNMGDLTTTARTAAPSQEALGLTTWTWCTAGNGNAGGIAAGKLYTWGNAGAQRLGDGASTNKSSPVQVGSATNWVSMKMSASCNGAINSSGELWVWGSNTNGALGDGTTTARSVPVQVGSLTNWSMITAGPDWMLAVKTDGTLWSWGEATTYGQTGHGNTTDTSSPVQIGSATDWASCYANQDSGYAVTTGGKLYSWGRNNQGQLGHGSTTNRSAPVQVGSLTNWGPLNPVSFHDGNSFLNVKTDGTLWAVGNNNSPAGTLGNGATTDLSSPVQIGARTDWAMTFNNNNNSNGVTTEGIMFGWGNGDGTSNTAIGDGTLNNYSSPVQVGNHSPWKQISSCNEHSIAITDDGKMWAWGDNATYGQLGDGTTVTKSFPVQVGTATNWTFCSSGSDVSYAVNSEGKLYFCGRAAYGQDGTGANINRSSMTQIGTLTDWVIVIGGGGSHAHAVKTNGTMWSWGYNANGQCGDGTTTVRSSPVQVGALTNWSADITKISVGNGQTYNIKTDGTMWSWGQNSGGEVGDNSTVHKSSPVQIGTATDWVSVAAGSGHGHAVNTSGQLYAWGYNFAGSLGLGDTTGRSSPVQVGALTDWAIPSGHGNSDNSFCTKTDGTGWLWGENAFGELGDGTTVDKSSPVQLGTRRDFLTCDTTTDSSHFIRNNSD